MRIAYYAPMKPPDHPIPSGDRQMARLFHEAMRRAGHEVRLACRLRTWDGSGTPARQSKLERLGRACARRILRRWSATSPDLWFTYHLYHKAPDHIGPIVARALAIPYVVAEASCAEKRAQGPWAAGHRAALEALRCADAVISVNSTDVAGIRPLVPPDRLALMAPFIDTGPSNAASVRRLEHRAVLADRLGVSSDGIWLVAVGMMRSGDKHRSWSLLAEALGFVRADGWTLIAVGDGPTRGDIEAEFAARLPRDRVRFTGLLEPAQIPSILAASDLCVWPAINEAYGMALLEAQAAGLPVIAGRTGGVPDIVEHGRTGHLVPVGDAVAFGKAVEGLVRDTPVLKAMGQAARARAVSRHDITTGTFALNDILERTMGRHRRCPDSS